MTMSTSWDGFRRRFAWSKVHEFMARFMLHAQRQISAAQRSSEMLFVFPSDGTWLRGWWVTASGLRRLPCPALHVPPVPPRSLEVTLPSIRGTPRSTVTACVEQGQANLGLGSRVTTYKHDCTYESQSWQQQGSFSSRVKRLEVA